MSEKREKIKVVDICKSFGDLVVLEQLNFDIYEGEFLCVVGPTGCGKTTFCNVVSSLLAETSGSITMHGEKVDPRKHNISFVFQEPSCLPWRTVWDDVKIGLEIKGAPREEIQRKVATIIGIVGLTGFERVYPHELSGGMAQRAAICRMLITEPAVLLLDEPFGALDELTREYMNVELQRICHGREATAFMVTHSIPEAVFLGDFVVVMTARPGKIREVVPVDLPRPRTLDMMTEPQFGGIVRHVRRLLDVGAQL